MQLSCTMYSGSRMLVLYHSTVTRSRLRSHALAPHANSSFKKSYVQSVLMHKESPGTASTGLRGLSPLCDSYCHEVNQLQVPLTSTNHCTRRQLSRNMAEPYPSDVGRSVGHSTGNVKGRLTKSSGHVLTTSTPLPRCASASTPSASPRPTSSPSLLVTSCHVVSRVPQALRRSLRRTTAVVAPCSSRATPASDVST